LDRIYQRPDGVQILWRHRLTRHKNAQLLQGTQHDVGHVERVQRLMHRLYRLCLPDRCLVAHGRRQREIL
jgi:hypothetical protein